MSVVSRQTPEGRYGSSRAADQRADRKLRIAAVICGTLLLALFAWFGWHYVAGNRISGEVIAFKAGEDRVRVHLEVRKDADATGYCTVRSQAADGQEVGRADFRFTGSATRVDRVVTLRTTSRGTTAELVGCHAD